MTPDETRDFLSRHHRSVLTTRRRDGGLQSSPVVHGVDGEGFVVISVTEDRAKTRNLRRDPRAALCAFTDAFYGPWVQVEGEAHIVDGTGALPGLEALYRQVRGEEHPDWEEFRAAMVRDRRCLIRIPVR